MLSNNPADPRGHDGGHPAPWRSNHAHCASKPGSSSYKYKRLHYKRPRVAHSSTTSSVTDTRHLTRYHGSLKWFDLHKQYGFLEWFDINEHIQKDIFVHESAFIHVAPPQILAMKGKPVSFNIAPYYDKRTGERKSKAINVSFVNPPHPQNQPPPPAALQTVVLNNPATPNTANLPSVGMENSVNNVHQASPIVHDVGTNETNMDDQRNIHSTQTQTESASMLTCPAVSSRPYRGELLWFNEKNKFGFIQCDELEPGSPLQYKGGGDLFVYETELKFDRELIHKGMRLQFDIQIYRDTKNGKEKRKAMNVVIEEFDVDAESIMSVESASTVSSAQNRTVPAIPWRPMTRFQDDEHSQPLQAPLAYGRVTYSKCKTSEQVPEYQGRLLWYDSTKRHGFIECDNVNVHDVFVYETDFRFPRGLIQNGMRLLFDIKQYRDANDKHRQKAIHVIIDTNPPPETPQEQETETEHHHQQILVDANHVNLLHPVPMPLAVAMPIQPSFGEAMVTKIDSVPTIQMPIGQRNDIAADQQVIPRQPQQRPPQQQEATVSEKASFNFKDVLNVAEFVPEPRNNNNFNAISISLDTIQEDEASDDELEFDDHEHKLDEHQTNNEEQITTAAQTTEHLSESVNISRSAAKRGNNARKKKKREDYKKIARKLFNMYVLKKKPVVFVMDDERKKRKHSKKKKRKFQKRPNTNTERKQSSREKKKEYDLAKVFEQLFEHNAAEFSSPESLLTVVLEFLSMIQERWSILHLVDYLQRTRQHNGDLIEQFVLRLSSMSDMNQDAICWAFRPFGLQCLCPVDSSQKAKIEQLISKRSELDEWTKSEWYQHVNYETMHLMVDYLIPKYCAADDDAQQRQIVEMFRLMVQNDDVEDVDNHAMLLLMSFITSICNHHDLLKSHYLALIEKLESEAILPFAVIEKWRMDECDVLTNHQHKHCKGRALMFLSDLVDTLQRKEIKENSLLQGFDTSTDEEINEAALDALQGTYGYIGTHELLRPNVNRQNIANRCSWKCTDLI